MTSFKDQVDEWTRETEARMTAVYRRSIELTGEDMAKTKPNGGRVPFRTGNLARSLLASKQGLPRTTDGPFAGSSIGAVTATLELNDTAFLGYQAKYAARVNYGFVGQDSLGRSYNQEGAHFVEGAIASWTANVQRAIGELKK